MASGSFHGGGGHSGSYHDIGGGSGGGSLGGSYGESYRGSYGGSSGDSYGASDHNADAVSITITIICALLLLAGAGYLTFGVLSGTIQGMNMVNLGFFCTGALFLFLGLKNYGRTCAVRYIRKGKMPDPKQGDSVWKGRPSLNAVGDSKSWADKEKISYRISFSDKEFGADNAEKVYDALKNTPGIIWMNQFVWLFISVGCAAAHFFFYELVIPYFEHSVMTDQAFRFTDILVFYLPSILVTLCGIACYIITRIRDRILHKCAIRVAEDNAAFEEKREAENYIDTTMSLKWYYDRCPNCGAEARHCNTACTTCGSSLEADLAENAHPANVHRLEKFDPDATAE